MTFSALSVIQPWPWLILRPDLASPEARVAARERGEIKDCENREWETNVRQWVLLHASSTRSAKWTYQEAAMFAAKRGVDVPLRDILPYGAVVGAVRIDECVTRSASRWFVGPNGFMLGAVVPFAEPIACGGAPKIFSLPLSTMPKEAQLELHKRLVAGIQAAELTKEFRLEEINQ